MGNDNRDQGKDTQQNLNKPSQGKEDLHNKPNQGKYDPQNKGQPSQGKDSHSDTKNKSQDPSAKKSPATFTK